MEVEDILITHAIAPDETGIEPEIDIFMLGFH